MGTAAWAARAVLEAPVRVNSNRLRVVFHSFRNREIRVRIDPRLPRRGKIDLKNFFILYFYIAIMRLLITIKFYLTTINQFYLAINNYLKN